MATFGALTNLNEQYSSPYRYQINVRGEIGDKPETFRAAAPDRYRQQMAEVAQSIDRAGGARWLREHMDERELTVVELARRAGVSPRAVRHALSGGRSRLLTQIKLSVALTTRRAA